MKNQEKPTVGKPKKLSTKGDDENYDQILDNAKKLWKNQSDDNDTESLEESNPECNS